MIKRRALMSAVAAGVSMMAVGICAANAQQSDRVRKIVLISDPQANSPQAFQAAQLIAQTWRQLGLDVEIKPMPRQQQSQVIWYERERWDTTMWRMVGRPERSDPDELVYNLFHSSTAKSGFNFVGYNNPDYDKIAELQRRTPDQEARRKLVGDAQAMIDRDQPYAFLVHPFNVHAFNKSVWNPSTIVTQSGVGIRNFWTFTGAAPVSAQKTMVLNARLALVAINPLYVSGATDSWVTELIWDRLARVGPDGLPRPWAAEKITAVDATTIEATIRKDMTWHDGRKVTVEDVVFSFEAPMQGEKVPMYRPFVADIAKVEAVGDSVVRFTLKQPNASFVTSSLAKINLVPKHIWEPVMKDLAGKPENAEQVRDPSVIGSGPFKLVRARLNEEIVLDRFAEHWAAPKMDRWILRIIPNPEATNGMLRKGEINFLADYGGDPELLSELAKDVPAIQVTHETDIGFEFVAFNNRRPPFDDPAFRRALSLAFDRNQMVQAAWNGFAVTANSHVSPALKFWHASAVDNPKTGIEIAKTTLQQAGYRLEGGKLLYPAGKQETLKPGE